MAGNGVGQRQRVASHGQDIITGFQDPAEVRRHHGGVGHRGERRRGDLGAESSTQCLFIGTEQHDAELPGRSARQPEAQRQRPLGLGAVVEGDEHRRHDVETAAEQQRAGLPPFE